MKQLTSLILCYLLVVNYTTGQQDSLVNEIATMGEVHYKAVGAAGVMTSQYQRYLALSESSNIDVLLKLVQHPSSAVKCYAAWGLIDKKYSKLPDVFNSFLKSKENVITFHGCSKDIEHISSILYHRYRFLISAENTQSDSTLIKLDSLILFSSKADWLQISFALKNRLYQPNYNPQIKKLAFEKLNIDALMYLSNWYKAENKAELQKYLCQYLKLTKFETKGVASLYEIIAELLSYKDKKINQIILNKLQEDKTWHYQEERFILLLEDYYIYEKIEIK